MAKATKFEVKLSKEYKVVVEPGKSITVFRELAEGFSERTFNIGDQAEHSSYNFSYYGPIVNITEKNVIVSDKTDRKTVRMPFERFAWRNWDFDVEAKAAENAETSYYI